MADVVIEFSAVVSITDGTGITIQTTGGKVFTYASHVGDDTTIITFTGTWDVAIAPDDVVTFEYDGFIGNIVDDSGAAIKSIPEMIIINCLGELPDGNYIVDGAGTFIVDSAGTFIVDGT